MTPLYSVIVRVMTKMSSEIIKNTGRWMHACSMHSRRLAGGDFLGIIQSDPGVTDTGM